MSKPYLNPETSRLSKALKFGASPHHCQCCGVAFALMNEPGEIWQEHDHHDHPEPIYIALCNKCSSKIIEPHPRLYKKLGDHEPAPGAMPICVDCPHRAGMKCNHKESKANGGKGILMLLPEPTRGFVDGAKYSGPFAIYHGPVTACEGKSVVDGQSVRETVLYNLIQKGKKEVSQLEIERLFPAKPGRETAIATFCETYKLKQSAGKDGSIIFEPLTIP